MSIYILIFFYYRRITSSIKQIIKKDVCEIRLFFIGVLLLTIIITILYSLFTPLGGSSFPF